MPQIRFAPKNKFRVILNTYSVNKNGYLKNISKQKLIKDYEKHGCAIKFVEQKNQKRKKITDPFYVLFNDKGRYISYCRLKDIGGQLKLNL